ncbi:MAG: TetR family transcriptional regulator [Frankiales bacterium]|nr:TetR family transcriptional regulator [Frankiales bacterium]
MGRVAGITPQQTQARLLRAAAEVFADRGYAGTRVADIAQAAGLSNGALYAHYASKAELLVGALRRHGRQRLTELFRGEEHRSIGSVLLQLGRTLPRRRDVRGELVVEALVAARRDEDVARLVRTHLAERADWLQELVEVGQAEGDLDPALPAAAVAHLCLVLGLGSALVPSDLHDVDGDAWNALLVRLIDALGPQTAAPGRGTT